MKWKFYKYFDRFFYPPIKCPICNFSTRPAGRNSRFNIVCCTECGHATTSVKVDDDSLNVLYDGLNYWHKDKGHQGIATFVEGDWDSFLSPRLESIYKHARFSDTFSQKVLEIGCSEGRLLYELKKRGHKVIGFEFNEALAEEGSKAFGLPIIGEGFDPEKTSGETFDLVLAYHTIEHVADVVKIVSGLSSVTGEFGKLVAEVPIETEYSNLDHIHFFTELSLRRLFGLYFSQVELISNGFTDANGNLIGSVYVIACNPIRFQHCCPIV